MIVHRMISAIALLSFTVAAAQAQDWKRHTFDKAQMSVELPGEPTAIPLDFPEEVKKKIKQMETHQLQKQDLEIVISYILYADDIEANLDGAAEGAVGNLKNNPGFTDFQTKTKEIKVGDLPGRRIDGTYKNGAMNLAFEMIIAADKNRLWQVIINRDTASAATKDISKRVLDSVKIGAAPSPAQPAAEAKGGWKRQTLGKFSLELPGEAKKIALDLPENVKSKIQQMETYQQEQTDLVTMLSTVLYTDDVVASLDGAAEGAIANMKNVPGVTDFKFKPQEYKVGDLPARRLNGSYKSGGKEIAFDMIITGEKNRMWQVIVNRDAGSPSATTTSKRILESVKIEK